MIKIRSSVFETNSSSCHSLCFQKDIFNEFGISETSFKTGILPITLRGYGWEWFRYYSVEGKLSYLLTAVLCRIGKTYAEPVLLKDLIETLEESSDLELIQAIEKTVKEVFDLEIEIHFGDDVYVDHESAYVYSEIKPENLKEFLLSPLCYVETGNDNSSPPFRINTDKGQEIYFRSIDYQPESEDVEIELTLPFEALSQRLIKDEEDFPLLSKSEVFYHFSYQGKTYYFAYAQHPQLQSLLQNSICFKAFKPYCVGDSSESVEKVATESAMGIFNMLSAQGDLQPLIFAKNFDLDLSQVRRPLPIQELEKLKKKQWNLPYLFDFMKVHLYIKKSILEEILEKVSDFDIEYALEEVYTSGVNSIENGSKYEADSLFVKSDEAAVFGQLKDLQAKHETKLKKLLEWKTSIKEYL